VSIYATALSFDADDHDDACPRWVRIPDGYDADRYGRVMFTDDGKYGYDDAKPCTCAAGPVKYEASHLLPSRSDPRAGSFSLCEIPGFISRDDRILCGPDDECDEPATVCCRRVWPWLRLWVTDDAPAEARHGSAVLLDRDQALRVYHYLGEWLMRSGEPT
jgi:hypothetical protein